jgi:hypothetical protein
VTVGVSDNDTWFVSESVRDNDIVHLLKQQFLGIVDERFILLGQELKFLSLQFIIIRHLEISLTNVDNILLITKNDTFFSYSLKVLNTYSSMGSSHKITSYPLLTRPTTKGLF